ncbi:TPA: hypothetical protein ACH3X1_001941 [Trebouxia sp. C0004]
MSLSRVWLSGCQPLARACASPPSSTYTFKAPFLGARSRIDQQVRTAPFLKDQRPSGLSSQHSNRILASASSLVSSSLWRRSRSRTRTNNTLSLCTVKLGARIVQRSVPCPSVADIFFVAEMHSLTRKALQLTLTKQGSAAPLFGMQVKGLFRKLKVDFTAVELDEVVEGEEVMDALLAITHRRTVPQVFIKGEFIGGCDDTVGAYSNGELAEKLSAAGIDPQL